MAEKVLKIKTLSEVAEAISGLTDLQGSLKGVGTAAFEAAGKSKAEWKALESELAKTTGTAKGMAEQAFKVESALNAMGRAGSQSQLETGLVKAKVELNAFKAKIDEVRAAGGTLDDGMVNSLKTMEAAVEAGKNKLNGLKEATETAKKQLGLVAPVADTAAKSLGGVKDQSVGVAKGVMAASGAVGPFGEILEKLGSSGNTAAGRIATLGFKVVASGAAFKVGYDAGTSFNKFLQEHGNLLERTIDLQVRHVQGLGTTKDLLSALPIAMNSTLKARQDLNAETAKTLAELQKESGGWKDLDKVRAEAMKRAEDISKRYNQLRADGKEWRGEMEEQGGSIAATTEILQRLGIQFKDMPMGFETVAKHIAEFTLRLDAAAFAARLTGDGVRGLRDTLESLPANLDDFTLPEVIDGLSKAIASAKAEGKDWSVILSDYGPELDKLRIAAQEAGEEGLALFREKILDLLPAHAAAIVALGDHAAAMDAWVAKEAAAYDRQVQAQRAARVETDRAADGMQKWTDATQGTGKAFGALSGDFTSLNKAVADYVAEGGDVNKLQVSMSTIALEVAKANDAATASIYRHLEATKLLREEQLQALDVAQGWRDYLANLKEGYDAGATSLSGYMKSLIDFKGQLLQLFGSVSGEAKRGLEDVIAMIEALMQTVGSREAFDTSYAGQAQRAFDKGGK